MDNENLQLNDLEKEILKIFLEKNSLKSEFFGREFELLKVVKRDMTGVGFFYRSTDS